MLVAQNHLPKSQKMVFDFVKMSGASNDFVIIDNRNYPKKINTEIVKKICHRSNIGCDQLILINNSLDKSAEIACEMQIFNSDGSQSSTCGNATRCVAKIIFDEDLSKNKIKIKTQAGILDCFKINEDLIKVNLGVPKVVNPQINLEGFEFIHINVGNPHAVAFVASIPQDEIFFKTGAKVENNLQHFPQKTNVEFAKIINDSLIEVRVFERGVGETLACGSGACAVGFSAIYKNLIKNSAVTVRFKGGDLLIEFDGTFIFMTAGTQKIFKGIIDEDFLS
jgi:diaminopimelate epimerase